MSYVAGIDGGGSKTTIRVADLSGRQVFECTGGPCNISSYDKSTVGSTIVELLSRCTDEVGRRVEGYECICLGCAGAGRESERQLLEGIVRNTGYSSRVVITDDFQTAMRGAIDERYGMILISGTGSVAYGRNSNGESMRAGGWGHLIGDEGSGYYIGTQILSHIMKSHDGREPGTILDQMAFDHLNISEHRQLVQYVYNPETRKKELAGIAKLLDKACEENDGTAIKICEDAARHLLELIDIVAERLDMGLTGVKTAFAGSILSNNTPVRRRLCEMVTEKYPQMNIINPLNDAAWGAVLIALEAAGNDTGL